MPFLYRLISRAEITAHNTALHVQLNGYNILDVSHQVHYSCRQGNAILRKPAHFTLHFDVLLHSQ